jgi:hypothetical protein
MRNKGLFGGLVALLLFLASSTFARFHTHKATEADLHRPNITEEGKIQVIINEMAQGIKKQKVEMVVRSFSQSFKEEDKIVGREKAKAKMEQFFANSAERMEDPLFVKKAPLAPNITSTWDFEIRDLKVTVDGNTASATCNLISLLAPPDLNDNQWHRGSRTKETFTFVKEGNFWRLESAEKLFNFLENYNQPSSPKQKESEEKSKRKPAKVKLQLK